MKKILAIVVGLLVASCVYPKSLPPVKVIEKVTVTDTIYVAEDMPMQFMDGLWWAKFWDIYREQYHGITFCWGRKSSIAQISPFAAESDKYFLYLHELTHQRQIARIGCTETMRDRRTVEGTLEAELEAYATDPRMRGEKLIDTLMYYDILKPLGVDSLRTLIKKARLY